MMNRKIKTTGLTFVENLSGDNLDKQDIFENLYRVLGEKTELSALKLPSSPAVAKLYSIQAEVRIRNNEQRIANIYQKLSKAGGDKSDIAEELKIFSAQPSDFAVIALNKYLLLDKKHTVEGFYLEYDAYRLNPRFMAPEEMYMFSETEALGQKLRI